jgi:hypothetical protein
MYEDNKKKKMYGKYDKKKKNNGDKNVMYFKEMKNDRVNKKEKKMIGS